MNDKTLEQDSVLVDFRDKLAEQVDKEFENRFCGVVHIVKMPAISDNGRGEIDVKMLTDSGEPFAVTFTPGQAEYLQAVLIRIRTWGMEPLTARENNLLKWVCEREGLTWPEAFFFERNFPRAIMKHLPPEHAVEVLDDWRTGMVMAIDEVVNELKTKVIASA